MKTVILANGDFPRRGGEAYRLLERAKRIVACDGAADALRRRLGREAEVVIGDLDSLAGRARGGANVVHVAEQDTNDLAKAIRYCRGRGWNDLVIVGATGKREDHTLGNVFRAMEAGVPVLTDHGRFLPVDGICALRVRKGAAVSVFATDPATRMLSSGLEWPLDGVVFENLYCATLNRAVSPRVTIDSDRPAFAYIGH